MRQKIYLGEHVCVSEREKETEMERFFERACKCVRERETEKNHPGKTVAADSLRAYVCVCVGVRAHVCTHMYTHHIDSPVMRTHSIYTRA